VNPVVLASALARLDAVCGEIAAPAVPGSTSGSEEATGSFRNAAPAVRLPASKQFDALEPDGGKSAVASAEDAAAEAERLLRFADERVADLRDQQFGSTTNPRAAEVETLKEQVDAESASLETRQRQADSAEEELNVFRKADVAFGSRGIQSYLFEGALAELSARVATYMETLTGGALTLALAPAANEIGTSSSRGAAKKSPSTKKKQKGSSSRTPSTGSEGNEVRSDDSDTDDAFGSSSDFESSADDSRLGVASEKIEKIVRARGLDGVLLRRSLRQLSGGERRRAALALALAHADLASSRGGVHCDLLVLDEVLQHLDAEGIARVAAALRAMPKKTILLTSQADSATSHLFDTVDRVFKRGGSAGVATASGASGGRGDEENHEDEDEARFAEREETA
jgi:ABC-type dipeptide/oligopeptide/nickel transport system ATPase subunit